MVRRHGGTGRLELGRLENERASFMYGRVWKFKDPWTARQYSARLFPSSLQGTMIKLPT